MRRKILLGKNAVKRKRISSFSGKFQASGRRFAIVVSRFNEIITRRLLEGALDTLFQAGALQNKIRVFWVPGALEIPLVCKKVAAKADAVIAIACVLRGDTYHYECVCHEVTRGISQAALETGTPFATAVITADNLEQALDRSGLKAGNKGAHAALTACEMVDLHQVISRLPDVKGVSKGGK